jgi:hypothetical protein
MIHRGIPRGTAALVVTLLMLSVAATAQAQVFRAYLESTGNDTNPCTLPAPCRLLPAALAAVESGGEIWMLDSANYNTAPVTITKSVTILAVPGAVGSVMAASGGAFGIGTAGVKVVLRNLVIVPPPGGAGANGIIVTNGAGLTVENCLIANLQGTGIWASASDVRVTNTTIRDHAFVGLYLANGARATVTRSTLSGNATYGIALQGALAGTTTTADIADSTLDGNGSGVDAWSLGAASVVKVSVRDSRIVRNSLGVHARSDAGASVTLSASNNIISNNVDGMLAENAGSKLWASGNTVSDNTGVGLANVGGLFESAGNNAVRNNSSNVSGTVTVIATD